LTTAARVARLPTSLRTFLKKGSHPPKSSPWANHPKGVTAHGCAAPPRRYPHPSFWETPASNALKGSPLFSEPLPKRHLPAGKNKEVQQQSNEGVAKIRELVSHQPGSDLFFMVHVVFPAHIHYDPFDFSSPEGERRPVFG